MATDITLTAATIIARPRHLRRRRRPFTFGSQSRASRPSASCTNETYSIANADHPVRPGNDELAIAERKDRAAALWRQVLPELKRYAEGCRKAKYTGWSKESSSPIRRVR